MKFFLKYWPLVLAGILSACADNDMYPAINPSETEQTRSAAEDVDSTNPENDSSEDDGSEDTSTDDTGTDDAGTEDPSTGQNPPEDSENPPSDPTIPEEPDSNPEETAAHCSTKGGKADQIGLKTWCWESVTIPAYTDKKGVAVSQGELHVDSECYEEQVFNSGNRLAFSVTPETPQVGDWCGRNYNMRAEIRTAPWDIRHPKGTEEWFGWRYGFSEDYLIDQHNQWKFFQVHPGMYGRSPQIGLEIINKDQFHGHGAGEIYVTTASAQTKYTPTGITPRGGQELDIVVHVIWDRAPNGWLQVWIDGKKVFDRHLSTVYADHPWGGNAKWGIYKWPWNQQEAVELSQQQGISALNTFMGPLRIITRKPGDSDYRIDSYAEVVPK